MLVTLSYLGNSVTSLLQNLILRLEFFDPSLAYPDPLSIAMRESVWSTDIERVVFAPSAN